MALYGKKSNRINVFYNICYFPALIPYKYKKTHGSVDKTWG